MEYALSFSLEGQDLKIALVSKQGKKFSIEFLHTFLREAGDCQPLKLLEPILAGKKVKTISALPALDVVLRQLQLPMTSKRKIFSVLPFQVETLLPFPIEETLLLPHIHKTRRNASTIFLTATKKDKLSSLCATLHALGIDPDQVSTSPHALARWATLSSDNVPFLKVAYLNRADSFFLFMEKGRILSAKPLSFTSSSSTSFLQQEIKKAEEFLASKFPESRESPWLFAGEGATKTPEGLYPTITLEEEFAQKNSYAIAIGLCIDALSSDNFSIQWRQDSFSPLHVQKKQKKHCLLAGGAFLGAALLFGPLGHFLCHRFENNLMERARTCLHLIAPEKKGRAQDLTSTCGVIDTCMLALKKEEKLGTFATKVSDLIAWLSACSTQEDKQGKRITLNSLNYLLTTDGRVDVHLVIESSPALADMFLKKIRKEDSLVDKNSKIIWKKENATSYSVQFYLK